MRGASHIRLGNYLADTYWGGIAPIYRRAFLLGCIQPDRNPASYLKGSLRYQWLRGHNYNNARRFLERVAQRLERKRLSSLWDYYTAGKLIHYTVDAFTYAHNAAFPSDLSRHRDYECDLQQRFLNFLDSLPVPGFGPSQSAGELIRIRHREYLSHWAGPDTDCRYAFTVCCQLMQQLQPA